LENSDGRGGD